MTTTDKITSVFEKYIDKKIIEKMLFCEDRMSELQINSLDFIKIIVELEEKFSIEVEDDRLSKDAFSSLNYFIHYIEDLINKQVK